MPLTSPVHPPSDSAVYFPSGKPGVSLSPSPACPPDARSKMTGTQAGLPKNCWQGPPFSLRPVIHTQEGGSAQPGERESRDKLGPAPGRWHRGERFHPEEPRGRLLHRERPLGGIQGRRKQAEAGGRPAQRTGELFTKDFAGAADFVHPLTGDKCGPGSRKAGSYAEGCSTQRPQYLGLQGPEMLRFKRRQETEEQWGHGLRSPTAGWVPIPED